MTIRHSGVVDGMLLHLEGGVCGGCGSRISAPVCDVRPERLVFACPRERCRSEHELRLAQVILLAKEDQARLGRAVPVFLLEERLSGNPYQMGVPGGGRLRLTVPSCAGCSRPRTYWLRDVYDTGPLFQCPACDREWHLHLRDVCQLTVRTRVRLGMGVPRRLETGADLLPAADRPPREEIFGQMREAHRVAAARLR